MKPHTIDPSVRHDAVLFFDVVDGNPNGDPDGGNRPRVDEATGHGLVTDVAIKRKIRDTIGFAAESLGYDLARYQIFVEAGHALNTRAVESYTATGIQPNAKKLTPQQAETARKWMTDRYVDVRLFGAVLSTGDTKALGQIRGPLQFGMARSIDPAMPVSHAITRITQTRQKDIDEGQSTEMGSKWTVPYALYRAQFHYSAALARRTGVTSEDLAALYHSLRFMFEHDRTATRGIMTLRGLYVFNHSDAFGNAPVQPLLDRITVKPTRDVPRAFSDYDIADDLGDLPAGITAEALHR
ncbi:type I-C CRISPR-associated protein Cas7/Csd2 [Micromonospora endophytica]|uniref:Type I-C CRISPR-associated protein Cas7/Csd2 n=1 Tax=Micromonospora endophytica TaxID=515350 RepID=A0A2W2CJC3_9ACTN|nr:type I-C CRISPR-associated protein Cas7/Csd2 [Micromonospora endophytica]PZF91788.1 type I-C CRISPR-associated protein Cas7/Csd2 [Micromonospora endophytica]RIW40238.1 type I-C CRISPR-associated protein Cas7/Csd2 [Micromonospora endophytica]BCJ58211.1 type I-C CRISPR-associated protein Cas7/Csd2 [Micromonospora endophytica]